MAPLDPHSFTDSTHPLTTHVDLSLFLRFDTKTIDGAATYTLQQPQIGDLFLDTRSLKIHDVTDPSSNALSFSLQTSDPIKGTLLSITLKGQASFHIKFTTDPSASALQWLNPPQTAGKKLPYVYTQCQPIHARSIFPCQDTPRARIRYSARLNIPEQMTAAMSAAHRGRAPPCAGEAMGACRDEEWVAHGRVVEHFSMSQPIPPYLFAFVVGNIVYKEVGPRTRVYCEAGPVLEAAAEEFEPVEAMIQQAEGLFGVYEWERFDLLVLPSSFPYGGMENPRLVFLTPTAIVGDTSGAYIVAHELAHSWTGNLVTNASHNDFWLNEGFTTYAERRIVEVVQGKERAELSIGVGCAELREDVEMFKDNMGVTKLKTNQEGINPDDIFSRVPYEKGFQFLWRVERQVGRPAFDEFLKKYIANFKFQSIDTETFIDFLKKNLPGIEKEVDLDVWIYGAGIPPDFMEPVSTIRSKVLAVSHNFAAGQMPSDDEVSNWKGWEWQLFLKNLPNKLEESQVSALDKRFQFSESNNWDVKVLFLKIVAYSGYKPLFGKIENCLKEAGRMKISKAPVYGFSTRQRRGRGEGVCQTSI
uniref:TSA: Wollemia nobilis Ref_Wollemi_Transcript_14816_2055 transcribed RNA sequence n=1 Tax=Wollemia nobilis TaxID=56998 RepID=A0A0C9S3R0_9CONI